MSNRQKLDISDTPCIMSIFGCHVKLKNIEVVISVNK